MRGAPPSAEVRTQRPHEAGEAFAAGGAGQRGVDDDDVAPSAGEFEDAAVVRNFARLAGLVGEAVTRREAAGELVVPLLGEQCVQKPAAFGARRERDALEERRGVAGGVSVAAGRRLDLR